MRTFYNDESEQFLLSPTEKHIVLEFTNCFLGKTMEWMGSTTANRNICVGACIGDRNIHNQMLNCADKKYYHATPPGLAIVLGLMLRVFRCKPSP
jgi:hypothetical protein